ncbi:hypothetical protein PIB30_055602 [Stylosanthes scabra]|uniref:Uncharacterized protein n=1 Tax=Stylosanthes scabra TaxID=79078 RepID=A0ABU6WKB4_9FABA|nr:hypothetical protein [Stylosanthes scabra]
MRVIGTEFLFPKSPSLLESDDNISLSHRFILAHFAFLGHFQSDSNLSRPETLEQTYQAPVICTFHLTAETLWDSTRY